MKATQIIPVIGLLTLSSMGYVESKSSLAKDLIGTWQLQEFIRITPEGKELPWCIGPHGLLTYTPDGFMSAAINCDPKTPADAPSSPYGNRLLYAGTYRLRATEVVHHVLNSNQLDLLGRDLTRRIASLKSGILTLTGEAANQQGSFRIVWKKAAKG